MRFQQLTLLHRMNNGRGNGWCIAGWHWKWSRTWRWALYLRKHHSAERLGIHKWRGEIIVSTPFFAIEFATQANQRLPAQARYL